MLNHITVMGRLVRDIETRTTQNGTQLAMFTIACDRGVQNGTDFIDCVAFKGTAGFVERNFHKGQLILVSGRLESSKWEKDGQKRVNWKVMVNEVNFCGDRHTNVTADVSTSGFEEISDEDGEIPF